MKENTILLTGVPRSGSTLSIEILNSQNNLVALDQPLNSSEFLLSFKNCQSLDYIGKAIERIRIQVQDKGIAPSLNSGGQISQHYSETLNKNNLRDHLVNRSFIHVRKNLPNNFNLIIKEFAPFIVHIDDLIKDYMIYAIVRNPLSVLASMNTLATLKNGIYDIYESLMPDLYKKIINQKGKQEKLLLLVSWYFEKCLDLKELNQIIYYEKVISTNGNELFSKMELNHTVNYELESRNINHLYDFNDFLSIGHTLLDSEGAYWNFYKKDDIWQLLKGCI